jgi:hypothetical protein
MGGLDESFWDALWTFTLIPVIDFHLPGNHAAVAIAFQT